MASRLSSAVWGNRIPKRINVFKISFSFTFFSSFYLNAVDTFLVLQLEFLIDTGSSNMAIAGEYSSNLLSSKSSTTSLIFFLLNEEYGRIKLAKM